MMAFWQWATGGHRIKDLKAQELADAATAILKKLGRNALSARLIYRALELDAYQPQALLMLCEFYRSKNKSGKPSGDEIYPGIIIEYAMDPKSPLTAEQKQAFEKARIETMNAWGFVRPRAGEFDIDYLGYVSFISELAVQTGSVTHGFRTALAKLGVSAGILDMSKKGATAVYQDWLRSDAATLAR